MEEDKSWSRRPHSAELKLRVLSECASPGASIARIAQAHGLNANLVHKWRRKAGVVLVKEAARGARKGDAKSEPPTAIEGIKQADEIAAGGFIALPLPQPLQLEVPKPATALAAPEIRIELRRGATAVAIHWPVDAGAECAAWLSAWLR